jgi:signal transduction histidine kinase
MKRTGGSAAQNLNEDHRHQFKLSTLFFALTVLSAFVNAISFANQTSAKHQLQSILRQQDQWLNIKSNFSTVDAFGYAIAAPVVVAMRENRSGNRQDQINEGVKLAQAEVWRLRKFLVSQRPLLGDSYVELRDDLLAVEGALPALATSSKLAITSSSPANAPATSFTYAYVAVAEFQQKAKVLRDDIDKQELKSFRRGVSITARLNSRTSIISLLSVAVMPFALLLGFLMYRREKRDELQRQATIEKLLDSEKIVAVAVKRLEESNRDLQDFAHVASHDLQEPLRKIVAFGDRLKSKYSADIPSDGLDYLDRMQSAAGRMQTLIQDLLTFSRVGSKGTSFKVVDLAEIAEGVASDLEVAVDRSNGVLVIGDLPTITADPTQMRQLLQNLIGNALKFSREGIPPKISVTASIVDGASPDVDKELRGTEPEFCRIEVRDNGIGFDEKYLDRIFKVFQRLHGRTEFEGSGVGLSVCRRIAEGHGGTITAQSTPDVGTTFIVTIPTTQQMVDDVSVSSPIEQPIDVNKSQALQLVHS